MTNRSRKQSVESAIRNRCKRPISLALAQETTPRRLLDAAAAWTDGDEPDRPMIGINCEVLPLRGPRPSDSFPLRRRTEKLRHFDGIQAEYVAAIAEAGAHAVLLPPQADAEMLKRLDGLLLAGSGCDVDPRNDGYQLHPAHRPMPASKEAFDRCLVRQARDMGVPLLAIGAGMQVLNVECGGTMAYHIPEDYPRALDHADHTDPWHGHPVYLAEGSLLECIYAERIGHVRSQHHQCVEDAGDGFVITAHSPDGVVEAIESTTDWCAMGVQWHPEFCTANAIDRTLFREFLTLVAAARKRNLPST